MIKRSLIVVHRWLGVALALFFLLWFPSGIGMMYWDFPAVTAADRLDRAPALNLKTIRLSPAEAYAIAGHTHLSELLAAPILMRRIETRCLPLDELAPGLPPHLVLEAYRRRRS